MRVSTTDGQVYDIPDFCPYCDMDTGGSHQSNCPLANVETWVDEQS